MERAHDRSMEVRWDASTIPQLLQGAKSDVYHRGKRVDDGRRKEGGACATIAAQHELKWRIELGWSCCNGVESVAGG
jgi:hypothetical protein